MNILEIGEVIQEVKNNSGKKFKEELIREHKDDVLFGKVLNHIYNPYIKTNIAKKKLSKVIKSSERDCEPFTRVEEYMEYLSKSTGKDIQIGSVQDYIASQPEEIRWLLESMATKDLKIGATSSTINKAFGFDFIPSFQPMLAEKYIETKKVKGVSKIFEHWRRYEGKRVITTKKIDGNRVLVFVNEDESVKLYTREGHEMHGYEDVEKAFKYFPKGTVYDGELLAENPEGLDSQLLFKKTSKIVKKKGIKTGVEVHLFDILPIKEFNKGGFHLSCEKRKEALEKVVYRMGQPLVKYVEPTYIGEFDFDIIDNLAEKAKLNKEEGIMVQLAESPYECRRTFSILKVKSMESADLRCLDVYEGKSGKNIGSLGGIVLDYKGYRVNCGGGFSDELRRSIWNDPSQVIGKIIEIQYFEEFEDDNGDLDLRFAIFKTVRDDKTEPSYY